MVFQAARATKATLIVEVENQSFRILIIRQYTGSRKSIIFLKSLIII